MTRFLPCARKGTFSGFVHFLAFTLIVSLALPLPAITEATTPSGSDHVLRRLNSLERAAAIADVPREEKAAQSTVPASEKTASADTLRSKTVTEALFNGITGFMGMPGFAGQSVDSAAGT